MHKNTASPIPPHRPQSRGLKSQGCAQASTGQGEGGHVAGLNPWRGALLILEYIFVLLVAFAFGTLVGMGVALSLI